jgi:hypothetical protein
VWAAGVAAGVKIGAIARARWASMRRIRRKIGSRTGARPALDAARV